MKNDKGEKIKDKEYMIKDDGWFKLKDEKGLIKDKDKIVKNLNCK